MVEGKRRPCAEGPSRRAGALRRAGLNAAAPAGPPRRFGTAPRSSNHPPVAPMLPKSHGWSAFPPSACASSWGRRRILTCALPRRPAAWRLPPLPKE